jgi:hypothetical protein
MGQRLALKEVDKRVRIRLNKAIKADGANGVMLFGEQNDYPQLIERLVNGSVTAKAAANIYAKFLTGQGFTNETINKVVVGRDARGKDITMLSLLRQVADSCAIFNGFYIKRAVNNGNETVKCELVPFKYCRFAKPDDTGYSAKILVHDNWERDVDNGTFYVKDAVPFHIFSGTDSVTIAQMTSASFNGQIYFQFVDNQFFYPLSPFDAAYLDIDTEAQIGLFKNRQIRDGFMNKIVFRVQPQATKTDANGNPVEDGENEMAESIRKFIGPDGESVLILEDDFDENGNIKEGGAFKIDKIETSVNDKLFENWEKNLANNIRKAATNIPRLLIEIEDGMFSGQSGEAIKQATNFYNALTRDTRELISQSFAELFKKTAIDQLKGVTDWSIKQLTLTEDGTTINNNPAAAN